MQTRAHGLFGTLVVCGMLAATGISATPRQPPETAAQAPSIDLQARLKAGTLRTFNRTVTPLADRPGAVLVDEREGPGVVWLTGTDFGTGTIDVDVRGRDVPQRSFVGLAFHGRDDTTYEAVYLRPFNFRNAEVARRQNAVQYMAAPDHDWPRLRKEFPGEFENPVDASIEPTDWVRLRIVVEPRMVRIYVGAPADPALEVRRLGTQDRGMIGLWTGNFSDGAFANLRITPAK